MEIILIRHGEAVEAAPGLGDPGRWLTVKGRRITRKVGKWLDQRKARRPVAIWTSSLVRAVQSAEIIAQEVGLEGEVVAQAELLPGADPNALLRLVTTFEGSGPLALVGHEPGLSHFARLLIGSEVPVPGLKKSGAIAIRYVPTDSEDKPAEIAFRFLLVPKGMTVVRSLEVAEETMTAAS
jgi:phosphohistidine phosphatase